LEKEHYRLHAVRQYLELCADQGPLTNIASLAAEICETPLAIISLVDDKQEHFIANAGTLVKENHTVNHPGIQTILETDFLTIPDCTKHKRFINTDVAAGFSETRFYAGSTLKSPDGFNVGRLFVLDRKPKQLTKSQEDCIRKLSRQALTFLEQCRRIKSFERFFANEALIKKQQKSLKQQLHLSECEQFQSHSARKPLSSILGLMSVIKEDNYMPHHEHLSGLETATIRLDEVIQTIVQANRTA
jgi:GAF domain-containing protein